MSKLYAYAHLRLFFLKLHFPLLFLGFFIPPRNYKKYSSTLHTYLEATYNFHLLSINSARFINQHFGRDPYFPFSRFHFKFIIIIKFHFIEPNWTTWCQTNLDLIFHQRNVLEFGTIRHNFMWRKNRRKLIDAQWTITQCDTTNNVCPRLLAVKYHICMR